MLSLMPYFGVRFRTEKMHTNEELIVKGYQGLFIYVPIHTYLHCVTLALARKEEGT
jgi:hypothetical protein